MFKIIHQEKNCKARTGIIQTPHGKIHTPAFVPVATKATVKALTPRQLEEIGFEVALGNTYHLYLRPGTDIVKKMGGLQKFMGWNKPLFTDSGGFQVFSLGFGRDQNVGKILKNKKQRVSNAARLLQGKSGVVSRLLQFARDIDEPACINDKVRSIENPSFGKMLGIRFS